MLCPRCRQPLQATLEQIPSGRVEIDSCPSCKGVWFDGGELALILQIGNAELFDLQSTLLEGATPSLLCPRHLDTQMFERDIATARVHALSGGAPDDAAAPLKIDQCPKCSGIWFDGGEVDALMSTLAESRMAPFLVDPQVKARPTSSWLWLFMVLTGLPIEGFVPRLRRPLCVWTLVALCVLGFLWQLGSPDGASILRQYALIPERLYSGEYRPLVTYMFLHGGLMHLAGNMYFLWVFGDNVEDRLGPSRFLLLYFLSGIGAAGFYAVLCRQPEVPVLGASGAIAGIMGAYAVLFPRARLVSLIVIFSVRWKTSTYLLIWLGYQIIGAAMGNPGIAWWAHIGGFLIGGAIAWPFRLGVSRGSILPSSRRGGPPALPPTGSNKLEWY